MDIKRVKEIFAEASALSEAERTAYLDRACEGDAALRAEVEAYLRAEAADTQAMMGKLEGAVVSLSEQPGTRIGRYKLLEKIGEGGFGVVFMAEQEEPVRRRVALKIIKLGMDTRQVVARFEAERQALAMMDHPSVAKVLDGGATDAGRPYFVMELVKGVPITEYCDKNRLSVKERLDLFSQVCQAVQHAHQKGLIHRDLKPSNVMVSTQDDTPLAKVIDFGIAKATQSRLTEKTLFTEFRQLIGTPEYMSPEQADGGLDVDTRSDVYSLGVLLYELLAGTPPFDPKELRSKAFAEMQRIIREVEPPTPSNRLSTQAHDTQTTTAGQRHSDPKHLAQSIRGELDWIVMKCLEKDRRRRYESASGLAADIRRYLSHEPISAARPSAWYRTQKFIRRNKRPVMAAMLVVIALVLGLIAATIGFVQASQQRRIAQSRFNDVRTLANKFMLDFHGKIQDLPGSTPAVKMLVETSLEYLNRLATETRGDVDLLRDLILAYQQIGDIQGNPEQHNLGDLTGALASYQRSLDLTRQLLAAHPSDTRASAHLVKLHWLRGDVLKTAGRIDEAAASYREGLQMITGGATTQPAAAPTTTPTARDLESQRAVARFTERIGSLYASGGDLKKCLTDYRRALDLYTKIAEAHPGDKQSQRDLAAMTMKLGDVIAARGDPEHPIQGGRPVFSSFYSWGNLDGDPASALVYQYRALDIYKQLAAADPASATAQRELALVQQAIGRTLADSNDPAGASAMLDSARRIIETLASSDKLSILLQWDLSRVYEDIVHARSGDGDPAGQLIWSRKLQAIVQKIWDADRNNRDAAHAVIGAQRTLAAAFRRTGDPIAAMDAYTRFEEMALRATANESDASDERRLLLQQMCWAYNSWGAMLNELGDADGAAARWRRCVETVRRCVPFNPADRNFNWNAAIWARNAAQHGLKMAEDPSRTPDQRRQLARQARLDLDEAMAHFRRMQDFGAIKKEERWPNDVAAEFKWCDRIERDIALAATQPASALAQRLPSTLATTFPTGWGALEALNQQAVALIHQKQVAQALKLREQLVADCARLLENETSDDPRLARYRVNLAELLIGARRFSEAETQLLKARLAGDNRLQGAELRNNVLAKLSELYQAWSSPDAQEAFAAAGPDGKPRRDDVLRSLDSQSRLARQLQQAGRLDDAAAIQIRLLQTAAQVLKDDDPALTPYEVQYARMLASTQRFAEAEQRLDKAIARAARDQTAQFTAAAIRAQIALYLSWQNPDRTARQKELEAQLKALPPKTILAATRSAGLESWRLEQHGAARGEVRLDDDGSLMITVTQNGDQHWQVQLIIGDLDMYDGNQYTVRFLARADREDLAWSLGASIDEGDYHSIGFATRPVLGKEWRPYEYTFVATGTHEKRNRLNLMVGEKVARVWFKEVTITEASTMPLILPAAPSPPPKPVSLEETLNQLNSKAYFLRRDNRLDEARATRLDVLEKAKAGFSPGDSRILKYRLDYVILLLQMERYDEAESVLTEALTDARSVKDLKQELRVSDALITVYTKWGKTDKALEFDRLSQKLAVTTRPATTQSTPIPTPTPTPAP